MATAKQVEDAIRGLCEKMDEQNDDWSHNFWYGGAPSYINGEFVGDDSEWGEARYELGELGVLEFVENTPSDPGDGKFYGSVWKLGGQYFLQCGYYSSWDSSEFDGEFLEVVPKDVTVTVWADAKSGVVVG